MSNEFQLFPLVVVSMGHIGWIVFSIASTVPESNPEIRSLLGVDTIYGIFNLLVTIFTLVAVN